MVTVDSIPLYYRKAAWSLFIDSWGIATHKFGSCDSWRSFNSMLNQDNFPILPLLNQFEVVLYSAANCLPILLSTQNESHCLTPFNCLNVFSGLYAENEPKLASHKISGIDSIHAIVLRKYAPNLASGLHKLYSRYFAISCHADCSKSISIFPVCQNSRELTDFSSNSSTTPLELKVLIISELVKPFLSDNVALPSLW